MSHYKVKDDSSLGQLSCGVCHLSESDYGFNPYGRDVKKAMADLNASEVDDKVLMAVENLDSNGDGTPNVKEISAGTAPGRVVSGSKSGDKGTASASETTPAKKAAPFPPRNGFHPAIVHFPIALFIGGLILDFLGMLRKDKTLLQSGWYCILMAAVTAIGSVFSGAFAMQLQKLPYKGIYLQHIALALTSSVLMFVMVGLRVHRHENMNRGLRAIYYLLAIACFVMISYAGHLGGVTVYGE